MEVFKPSDKFKHDFDKAANKAAREVSALMRAKQMKRIEDAPKELQDMFEIVWEQVVCSASGISDYRDEIEHAFLKGFDTAMATAGVRQGRRIAEVMQTDDKLICISNDGQAFVWNENDMKWEPMPHLPQD